MTLSQVNGVTIPGKWCHYTTDIVSLSQTYSDTISLKGLFR